jgi:hypothetical protein
MSPVLQSSLTTHPDPAPGSWLNGSIPTYANTFVRHPDWSPEGRNVVYEYGTSSANVWLLKLAKK